MNTMNLKVLISAISLTVLCGCANTTPYLENRFGEAVNSAIAQQTINPDASLNTDPVAGIDGQSAADSIDGYHSTFKAPPPTFNVININSGGGGR
jgi:hypothetical protein